MAAMSRVSDTTVDLQSETKGDEDDEGDKSMKKKANQSEADRSYAELHLAGDAALQSGDLDLAEQLFAFALKEIHDRESPRLQEEEECLRKLGTVYVRRGTQTKDGQDFAKATALYTAALARRGDKHLLIDSIKEAERLFLYHTVGISCKPPNYETDLEHKDRLKEHRAEVKVRLETIHNDHNPYQYDEKDPLVKDVEMKRAESVRELFKYISEQRKNFIKDLAEECIETIGPPPCKYAMVGLGSQATELVTPYSDLEFAILVEENEDTQENKEYFRNITCYLYLKIINLGETILPAVAIKSLNDFNSEDPTDSWFYDSVTPRGFAFDGAMPWASKTPFGRESTSTKVAVSLIQTPSGMAEFQRHDVAVTYGYHMSDILRYVSYLTGDQALVDDYISRVIQELWTFDEQRNTTVAFSFARASITRTMREHQQHQRLTDKLLDVKKEIYRFPTVAIVNLSLLWGVYATSVWDAIKEMERQGVVTKEHAHHLQVLMSISGELRLRTYLELGAQRENLSGLLAMGKQRDDDDETLFKTVFYVPDQKMLFRYFYTAHPLQHYMFAASFGLTDREIIITTIGRETVLYDASPVVKADICIKLLQFDALISVTEELQRELEEGKHAKSWFGPTTGNLCAKALLLTFRAFSYSKRGYHRQAISCREEQLKITHELFGYGTERAEVVHIYESLGSEWGNLDSEKSLEYHEKALSIQKALLGKDAVDPVIAGILHNIGAAWVRIGDNEKAISYVESGMNMLKSIHEDNEAHPDIAHSLGSLGICWAKLGDLKKAIKYGEEAVRMSKAIYGQDTAHPAIAASLTNLGISLCGLNDHVKALRYLTEALEMNKVIHGSDTPHPDTAKSLALLGHEWRHIGDNKKANSLYEEALQMLRLLYGGDEACHPQVARILQNLGSLWDDDGDIEKARVFYEQALKMYRELYGQTTPHPDTVTSLFTMGIVLEKSGETFKAINSYEEALKMLEDCLSNKERLYIAVLLFRLGPACRKLGEYTKSLQYNERALEIFRRIYGQAHPCIAESLIEVAAVYQELGDYTKTLCLYEEALDMMKVIYGPRESHRGDEARHPEIARALSHLGICWYIAGDNHKALPFCEQALEMCQELYGPTNPHCDTARSLSWVGAVLEASGDTVKAISYHEESLKMMEQVLDKSKTEIALLLRNLGSSYRKVGEYTRSIRYYERALEINKETYGQDMSHPAIVESLSDLAAVYEDRGDHANTNLYRDTLDTHGVNDKHPDIFKLNSKLETVNNKPEDHEEPSEYQEQASTLQTVYSLIIERCVIM